MPEVCLAAVPSLQTDSAEQTRQKIKTLQQPWLEDPKQWTVQRPDGDPVSCMHGERPSCLSRASLSPRRRTAVPLCGHSALSWIAANTVWLALTA